VHVTKGELKKGKGSWDDAKEMGATNGMGNKKERGLTRPRAGQTEKDETMGERNECRKGGDAVGEWDQNHCKASKILSTIAFDQFTGKEPEKRGRVRQSWSKKKKKKKKAANPRLPLHRREEERDRIRK